MRQITRVITIQVTSCCLYMIFILVLWTQVTTVAAECPLGCSVRCTRERKVKTIYRKCCFFNSNQSSVMAMLDFGVCETVPYKRKKKYCPCYLWRCFRVQGHQEVLEWTRASSLLTENQRDVLPLLFFFLISVTVLFMDDFFFLHLPILPQEGNSVLFSNVLQIDIYVKSAVLIMII